MGDAPDTNFRSGEEEDDRQTLLPELSRAVSVVNELMNQVIDSDASQYRPSQEGRIDLPWVSDSRNNTYNRHQLQTLAPLLDRLGRTLTDAAPHVAALAESLPSPRNAASNSISVDSEDDDDSTPGSHPNANSGGLLSLWNRERRNQSSIQSNEDRTGLLTDEDLDPDYADFASGVVNTSRGEVRAGPRSRPQTDDVASLLGAYLAAASLGNAVVGDNDSSEEGSNGPQSLGSILRERGNGGTGGSGGIDIHIHAVVTTPGGGGGGGLGLAALGPPIPTATVIAAGGGGAGASGNGGAGNTGRGRTLFATRDRGSRTPSILRSRNSQSSTATTPTDDEIEDTSLFAELYSENPEPVDPNGSPEPDARRASMPPTVDNDDTDFIRRIASVNEDGHNDSNNPNNRRNRNSFRRSAPERRGWGRLFRRRRGHRDSDL